MAAGQENVETKVSENVETKALLGFGIAIGSIFFVNVVKVTCTRRGHARISFSGFALVHIEKPARTQLNYIEPD